MPTNDLEFIVNDTIIDICEVMMTRGYESVSVGAIMRLLGVAPDRAQEHDSELFNLDDGFKLLLRERKKLNRNKMSPGELLH